MEVALGSQLLMPQQSAREQLLRFLDDHVFQPALGAQPLAYTTAEDQKLLKAVQKRVHESRTRYVADYPSAADIKGNFIQDLHSKPGQALASDMWQLKLTRFEDIQPAFLALCHQLGV
jgi:hypothetical protein